MNRVDRAPDAECAVPCVCVNVHRIWEVLPLVEFVTDFVVKHPSVEILIADGLASRVSAVSPRRAGQAMPAFPVSPSCTA